ncbi:MAG TPA: hypothetical protein VE998_11195, partial [Terriglobales bacterium]|nr:hypothetical protein [Terriglobales bacterium]
MKRALVLMMALWAAAAWAQPAGAAAGLGTVNFQTTCRPDVQGNFNHAVALLHSFEYDESRDTFLAVAKADPHCAMAYWGAAMTEFHALWGEIDVAAGHKFAAQAQAAADADPQTSPREKQFIQAVSAIYADADVPLSARSKKFSDAMAEVHSANPGDDEAAIFYALSLDESAGSDPASPNRQKCGDILEPLFEKMPNHPGVAHYLIHCYDNPVLAPKGVSAARAYAKIAPD